MFIIIINHLPNSIIIISLSVINVDIGSFTPLPTSFRSNFSNPPTITSHTQCGDIVTAVSECWYLPVTDSGRGICRQREVYK